MTQQYLQGCQKLISKGQFQEAITGFEFVLKLEPSSVDAFRGMAFCYSKLRDWQKSLTSMINALGHGGYQAADLAMFLNIVETSQLLSYVPLVEQNLKRAMQYLQLEKQATTQLAIQLKAKYRQVLDTEVLTLDDTFSQVLTDNTLHLLIERSYVADYGIEHVLRSGREVLLKAVAEGQDVEQYLPFMAALACQTLLHDHLYDTGNSEQDLLDHFAADSNELPILLMRLCYSDFTGAMQIWQQHQDVLEAGKVPHLAQDLAFYHQVVNSKDNGEISDKTSKKVQAFYMENPYPKWKAVTTETIDIASILKKLEKPAIGEPQVLLAGCGTGRQVIEWALTNPKASFVAIDLSPVSVAYAQQMAKKYKVTNVDFKVHDILEVDKLDQSFDFIISTGVLHHMGVPQDGVTALSNVLRPDGIMYLSFYSKVARVELEEIKQEILGYLGCDESGLTAEGLRKWRGQLTPQDKQRDWFKIGDFFYLNGLMDLLFHPQQTEYSALEIDDMLQNAGLSFKWLPVGFEYQQIYKASFDKQPIPTENESLTYWHEFEQNNPKFFAGQFKFFAVKS